MAKRARRKISEEVLKAVSDLGFRLAEARKRKLMSQEELAFEAGITRLLLSRIENGSTTTALAPYVAIMTALGLAEHVEELAHPARLPFGHLGLKRPQRGKYNPL